MENKPAVCAYCGVSLNGQVRFTRNHRIFCDVEHATLFDYSDFIPLPPHIAPEARKEEDKHEPVL